jgi:membrane associated rhomboid family serine protease
MHILMNMFTLIIFSPMLNKHHGNVDMSFLVIILVLGSSAIALGIEMSKQICLEIDCKNVYSGQS